MRALIALLVAGLLAGCAVHGQTELELEACADGNGVCRARLVDGKERGAVDFTYSRGADGSVSLHYRTTGSRPGERVRVEAEALELLPGVLP